MIYILEQSASFLLDRASVDEKSPISTFFLQSFFSPSVFLLSKNKRYLETFYLWYESFGI
jgi:hypothetical protein